MGTAKIRKCEYKSGVKRVECVVGGDEQHQNMWLWYYYCVRHCVAEVMLQWTVETARKFSQTDYTFKGMWSVCAQWSVWTPNIHGLRHLLYCLLILVKSNNITKSVIILTLVWGTCLPPSTHTSCLKVVIHSVVSKLWLYKQLKPLIPKKAFLWVV